MPFKGRDDTRIIDDDCECLVVVPTYQCFLQGRSILREACVLVHNVHNHSKHSKYGHINLNINGITEAHVNLHTYSYTDIYMFFIILKYLCGDIHISILLNKMLLYYF